MVSRAGLEPAISGLKVRRPLQLDHRDVRGGGPPESRTPSAGFGIPRPPARAACSAMTGPGTGCADEEIRTLNGPLDRRLPLPGGRVGIVVSGRRSVVRSCIRSWQRRRESNPTCPAQNRAPPPGTPQSSTQDWLAEPDSNLRQWRALLPETRNPPRGRVVDRSNSKGLVDIRPACARAPTRPARRDLACGRRARFRYSSFVIPAVSDGSPLKSVPQTRKTRLGGGSSIGRAEKARRCQTRARTRSHASCWRRSFVSLAKCVCMARSVAAHPCIVVRRSLFFQGVSDARERTTPDRSARPPRARASRRPRPARSPAPRASP